MSSAAESAILEGMPEAADLRVLRSDGVTWVFAGKTALFRFADGDSAFGGTARAARAGGVFSRYAGAMLLHAYPGQAGEILPQAAGGDAREAALLSAVSACFALGAATAEQVKHLAPGEAGPLAGLAALPSLRTLRPRLAAAPGMLPVLSVITVGGKARAVAWAEETVQLKDYGEARQITLFEHGRVVLQVLTSDFDACPAALLGWLKSRWREENYLKYASENYGIDKICDYAAGIETNTKIVDNPARKEGNAAVREAEKNLAAAERGLAAMLADPAITPAVKNATLIPAAERAIAAARRKLDTAKKARDAIPAKLPANQIDPQAQVALLRTGRRGLQMVLRLLAHNAEHWLSDQLNAYLRDDDEYRAITCETIIRGTAGVITFTPETVTVTLARPAEPRVARALTLLTDQINAVPPRMPGDTRPITYQLTASPAI